MTLEEAMGQLEALGAAENRRIWSRHGVRGAMFGVSYADLGKLKKQIKVDHALALALWDTANHDARVLATQIADPNRLDTARLEALVADLDGYVITGALADLVARSPLARAALERWIRNPVEWTSEAGWNVLCRRVADDPSFSDEELAAYLEIIEKNLHSAPNRTRHAMNNALIAIGARNDGLEAKALAAAARIGRVVVDHGETGCKTPDAAAYIRKTRARQEAKAERKKG